MTRASRPKPVPASASAVPDDAVLDAAAELLMSIGVRRTTLTEVARRAGVSRMTLYRRWPDLRSLVRDVMTREWSRIVTVAGATGSTETTGTANTASAPRPAGEAARAARAELVRSLVTTAQAFHTNPLFVSITESDGELLAPYILERLGSTQLLVLELVRERLVAARAAGAVRAGDPAAQARMVLLATQSYVLSAGALGDETTREALARELYLMLDGYLAPPEVPRLVEGAPSSRTRPVEQPGAPT